MICTGKGLGLRAAQPAAAARDETKLYWCSLAVRVRYVCGYVCTRPNQEKGNDTNPNVVYQYENVRPVSFPISGWLKSE